MQLQFSNKQIICSSLLCFSAMAFPLTSQAITVQEVPNPRQVNNTWVTDNANILSDRTETQLNQMISDLEAKNGSEIAVVTVPDTKPSATPKAFATELFNSWGIGKKGKNNGVLLLISSGESRVQIETGSGIQSILPDAKVVKIIKTEIRPRFKQQDLDGGTLAGTKALVNVLQTPTVNAQSQTTLPLAPIVPAQGVKPSPIPSQSPVISHSKSTGEDSATSINGLLLALFIALIPGFIIFKIFPSLFSRKSRSPHRRYPRNYSSNSPNYGSHNRNYSSNNRNYSSNSPNYSSNSVDYSSTSDYSTNSSSDDGGGYYCTNSSDYSISNSDCGGSFGGGNSSGGGADYSSSISSSDCGGSFGGGNSSGGGAGADYSSSSSSSDYSSSSSDYSSSSSSSDYSSSSSSSDSSSGGGGGDW
ncbi:TPM domain-containing protein [Microcoleus vaginatus ZQ-A3]|uniref:TPM domain-containing protein n=1 Tax=Microcoleus vaginatus TaxID=119532 RepID=UPI0018F0233F